MRVFFEKLTEVTVHDSVPVLFACIISTLKYIDN